MNSHIEKDIGEIIKAVEEISDNIKIKIIEMMHPIDERGVNMYIPIDKNSPYNQWKYECCNSKCDGCFVNWGPIILPNGDIQLCENVPIKVKDVLKNNNVTFSCVDYRKNIIRKD